MSKKQIDIAIERLKKHKKPDGVRQESVLEKVLQIDENYAMVMSLDMLSAGIHSVRLLSKLIRISFVLKKKLHLKDSRSNSWTHVQSR